MDERKKLANQIWFTRIARIKAEERLINKENFIQFVNIYYSFLAIICSILSFSYDDKSMGLFTIIITIGLMVSILYLNGQKYLEKARDYRTNYTQLQLLEFELKNLEYDIEKIQKEYCDLLNTSSNHIEYDYLKAIENSSDEYKEQKDWKHKKIKYYYEIIWRLIVKIIICVAPFLLLYFCEVFA